MSSLNEVPNEVLSVIFFYLKEEDDCVYQKDLAQCALICRRWRMEAQLIFFSSIYLNSEIQIEKINRLISANAMIKNWVKRVTTGFRIKTNKVLSTIDTLFPKLENLYLTSCDASCYFFLVKMITKNNKFVNLNSVPYLDSFDSRRTQGLYVKCLSYMKERLTSIYLDEGNISYLSFRDKLNQFSNLKTIRLRAYYTNTKKQSVVQYLDSLTNYSTTSLKEIYIEIIQKGRDEPSFAEPMELSKIDHPINSMKKLTIKLEYIYTIPVLDEKCMVYFMNKFPKLKYLNLAKYKIFGEKQDDIDVSDYDFPVAVNGAMQTPEVTLQFLNYLYKIPNCSVKNIIIPVDTPVSVIYGFYEGVKTKSVTDFSNCLRTGSQACEIFGDENSVNDACISSYESNILKKTRKITVLFDGTDTLYDEQQLRLIEKCGQYFDTMCLKITATVKFDQLLDYITKYCSRLNNLAISKEYVKYNLFEKEKKDINKGLGVTCLALRKSIPPPEQFPYISLCFPHLKTLILDQCFEKLQDERSFFTLRMPKTCLENIKIKMQIFLRGADMNTMNALYIKFTTETQQADRFFFITRTWGKVFFLLHRISTNLTEVDYENSIPNQNILTCHIHCRSVDTITVEYNDSNPFVEPTIVTF